MPKDYSWHFLYLFRKARSIMIKSSFVMELWFTNIPFILPNNAFWFSVRFSYFIFITLFFNNIFLFLDSLSCFFQSYKFIIHFSSPLQLYGLLYSSFQNFGNSKVYLPCNE